MLINRYTPFLTTFYICGRGGVVFSALAFISEGRGFKPAPLHHVIFKRQEILLDVVSLHPGA